MMGHYWDTNLNSGERFTEKGEMLGIKVRVPLIRYTVTDLE